MRPLPVLTILASALAVAGTPAPEGTGLTYTGHGLSSVPADVLARFSPPTLPEGLARHLQSLYDVRSSPGMGRVGPDGRSLYYNWTVTGISQVWRLDGPLRLPAQLTGGEDRTGMVGVAPDGSFILIERDQNGEENPGLYWMDARGGPLHLVQHKPGVQTFADFISEDSRYIYFHANDVRPDRYSLYRWDRTRGERELVFDQEGLWSVGDHLPNGLLLLAREVGSNMFEYSLYEPATRKLTPVLGQGEREDYHVRFAAQPGEFLVLTPHLGNFQRLYRLRSGQLTPITPDMPHEVSGFAVDEARRRIYYQVNDGGYTRLHVLDARSYKELPLPTLPQADHLWLASVSRDGRYAALGLQTWDAPQTTFVLDWQTRKATLWLRPSTPEVDTGTFARPTLESYPARDGTSIPMFVRRPPGCDKALCPVVVFFHGGPEGQSVPTFNPFAQAFVDDGFIYVEPNVRGSEGYGKAWLHADDGPRRLSVITDIEDCARYLRKAWARDGRAPRVGIYGGSYGGYSTLVGMTMFAGAYDVGVAVVGMSNLVTFLQNTAPYRRDLRISEYGDPERDHAALVKLSPITYVDRVRGPLLVIQGATDPRVPVGEALLIHRALDAHKVPNSLIIFPDEGHGAAKRGNVVLQVGHALRFFDEHLKEPALGAAGQR